MADRHGCIRAGSAFHRAPQQRYRRCCGDFRHRARSRCVASWALGSADRAQFYQCWRQQAGGVFDCRRTPREDAQQDSVLAQLLQQQQSIQDMLAGMQSKAVKSLCRERAGTQAGGLGAKPATATPPAALPAAAPQMFAEAERVGLPSRAAERLAGLVGPAPRCKGDLGGTAAQRPLVSVDRAGAATAEDGSEADEEPVGEVPKVAATPDSVLAQLLQAQTKILQQLLVREFKVCSLAAAPTTTTPLAPRLQGCGAWQPGESVRPASRPSCPCHQAAPSSRPSSPRRCAAGCRGDVRPLQGDSASWQLQDPDVLQLPVVQSLGARGARGRSCLASHHRSRAVLCRAGCARARARLLTRIPDPPFSQTEGRRAPRADLPHGQLSDPKWIATSLAFLRDCDSIAERTYRTHEAFRSTGPPAKSGGKGKRKKRQQAEAQGDGSQ